MIKTKFQTPVEIPQFSTKTGYEKNNLFMGSCFTENIGLRMANLKYPVDINPFGILYNPVSVANGLNILLKQQRFEKNDLIEHNGFWHSFSHHGRFSSTNAEETLTAINNRISSSGEFLKKADFLFITFGTAWVYRYKKTGQIVSNCHKIPAREFERFRLNVDEIVGKFGEILNRVRNRNNSLKIVFTVSPIRHWKDGAIENQRSKSTLLLAVDQLIKNSGEDKCSYFPSYEIMMDELRDYRFYAEDMIHPSEVAVNHIWEIFQEKLIGPESIEISKKVQKISSALNHKSINKFTNENLLFLNQTLDKINELKQRYPILKFSTEEQNLTKQINEIRTGK